MLCGPVGPRLHRNRNLPGCRAPIRLWTMEAMGCWMVEWTAFCVTSSVNKKGAEAPSRVRGKGVERRETRPSFEEIPADHPVAPESSTHVLALDLMGAESGLAKIAQAGGYARLGISGCIRQFREGPPGAVPQGIQNTCVLVCQPSTVTLEDEGFAVADGYVHHSGSFNAGIWAETQRRRSTFRSCLRLGL